MRTILILLLGLIPLYAHARLGETPDQLQQRFGSPVMVYKDMIIAQGKMIELCPIYSFKQDDWNITCHIIDGRSSKESYSKKGDWTDDQIQLVLSSNTQGAKWTETSNPALKKLKREWKREDGATAVWQLGGGFTLTHPAYPLAKQRAQDKAKANASRLPNL
ncbi:MAG TPA: hypothetical protein VL357_12050 [Rariglobus sp.]|jgi:hypothetical protein|nr:hypothetical protein [Rariglobus sp.]